MAKLRVDDEVIVLAGKDKGRVGTIQRMMPNGKAIVSGVNRVKKHQKPNPNLQIAGGIIDKEAPIHCSNLAIRNPETEKADRIGFVMTEDGSKNRVFKSTRELVDADATTEEKKD